MLNSETKDIVQEEPTKRLQLAQIRSLQTEYGYHLSATKDQSRRVLTQLRVAESFLEFLIPYDQLKLQALCQYSYNSLLGHLQPQIAFPVYYNWPESRRFGKILYKLKSTTRLLSSVSSGNISLLGHQMIQLGTEIYVLRSPGRRLLKY